VVEAGGGFGDAQVHLAAFKLSVPWQPWVSAARVSLEHQYARGYKGGIASAYQW
jgi:hypothetical protein